jgi:hypothetical protein
MYVQISSTSHMLLTLEICLQFCSVKANEFWVMNLNDQSGDSSYYQPPIPMYKRLRKVTLLPQKWVDCNCGRATDMRMPCGSLRQSPKRCGQQRSFL